MSSSQHSIPRTQTVALVRELGGQIEFVDDYPVPVIGPNEVLVKVLYTGVCQSDLHTKAGTAPGPTGNPITAIKLPHIGGHEGVGRIVAFGPDSANISNSDLKLGTLIGIRFLSRVCGSCEFCAAGEEQYCGKSTNHLHHEDGSFQEYCVLDRGYLTVLPEALGGREEEKREWEKSVGPVLCAGVTAYKAVLNANCGKGRWLVVVGAGGGLGHLAGESQQHAAMWYVMVADLWDPKVQYGRALGADVLGIDTGEAKKAFVESLGATKFIDFAKSSNLVKEVIEATDGGAQAVVVASGNTRAYSQAADMLKIGGTLCCIGIPPGKSYIETPVASIVIKGLRIVGNLVGTMKETLEAVELARQGKVKTHVQVREFKELPEVYEMLEKGDITGRIVLRIGGE